MLILTAVPFVSVVYTVESWPWGNRMCVVSEFMKDFSTGVSVFTLVAMSLDRFVAIVNPLRRFQGTGKLNLLVLLDRPHRLRTFSYHHTAHFWFFILIWSICRWFASNSHSDSCGKLYCILNHQLSNTIQKQQQQQEKREYKFPYSAMHATNQNQNRMQNIWI